VKFPYQGPCEHEKLLAAPALEAHHVYSGYPGGNRSALKDISITIAQGMRVALVGANGAGKSTLLKAIAGLLPIVSGTLKVFGHNVGGCLHQVAYLPQGAAIDWSFPVSLFDFLLAGRYVHLGWLQYPSKSDRKIVNETLELLQLVELKNNSIQHLSGGQKQRALLGRALVHKADLFLLDEPLSAIDARNRHIISIVLDDLRNKGKTVFMATHDLGGLETDFDNAYFMHDGKQVNSAQWASKHKMEDS